MEAEIHGYLEDALVQGLKAAGRRLTQASFINAMLAMNADQGLGTRAGHSISWADGRRGEVSGAETGDGSPIPGHDLHRTLGESICGSTVQGKKIVTGAGTGSAIIVVDPRSRRSVGEAKVTLGARSNVQGDGDPDRA